MPRSSCACSGVRSAGSIANSLHGVTVCLYYNNSTTSTHAAAKRARRGPGGWLAPQVPATVGASHPHGTLPVGRGMRHLGRGGWHFRCQPLQVPATCAVLLDGDALGEVAGLIDVAAATDGDVVRE